MANQTLYLEAWNATLQKYEELYKHWYKLDGDRKARDHGMPSQFAFARLALFVHNTCVSRFR